MKILIADDEPVTRNGLYTSIDWTSLGIDTVVLAEDGLHALDLAKSEKPDIILSDIRMPRMNGLEMVAALESILPNTAVIFMSGYSDKEYLKTAIRLHAVTYVEKPIVETELTEALIEARESVLSRRRLTTAYSHEQLRRLGRLLTRPLRDASTFFAAAADAGLQLLEKDGCYPIIVRFGSPSQSNEGGRVISADSVSAIIREFFLEDDIAFCYTDTHEHYLALFIFTDRPDSLGHKRLLQRLKQHLDGSLSGQLLFQLCAGEYAATVEQIHDRYTQTAILSQQAFFFNRRLLYESDVTGPRIDPGESQAADGRAPAGSTFSETAALQAFREACEANVRARVIDTLEDIYQSLCDRSLLMAPQCKDLYYRMALEIEAAARRSKQSLRHDDGLRRTVPLLEAIEGCFSLSQLHQYVCLISNRYFDVSENSSSEDLSVYLIKEYIHQHYAEESLSIKQISEHVFLSVSYLCTYFKAQTGQTLNQYITDYRMDKACRLLEDGRIPITEIAARVGYSNSNYFGKGFKKHSGQTPSAYRDSHLR